MALNALSTYVFKDYFELISFDSAAFTQSVRYARYLLPVVHKWVYATRKGKGFEEVPCMCPACQLFSKHYPPQCISNPGSITQYTILYLHNLYQLLSLFKVANYSLETVEELASPGIKDAIEFARDIIKVGFEKAHTKWYGGKGLGRWF